MSPSHRHSKYWRRRGTAGWPLQPPANKRERDHPWLILSHNRALLLLVQIEDAPGNSGCVPACTRASNAAQPTSKLVWTRSMTVILEPLQLTRGAAVRPGTPRLPLASAAPESLTTAAVRRSVRNADLSPLSLPWAQKSYPADTRVVQPT